LPGRQPDLDTATVLCMLIIPEPFQNRLGDCVKLPRSLVLLFSFLFQALWA
jgi:hypothetical protein